MASNLKEFCTITHAIKSFKHYLNNYLIQPCSLGTHTHEFKRISRRKIRTMQEYDTNATYSPGKKKGNADGVSHILTPEEEAMQN